MNKIGKRSAICRGFNPPWPFELNEKRLTNLSRCWTFIPGSIAVGSFPLGVAVTPDARFAYVANSNDTVSVIDTATNAAPATTILVGTGTQPFGIALTPDGRFAYVTNGNNTVSVISTATNTVFGSPIAVGITPEGVAITPDGRFAYVTNFNSNTVSVISTATNAVVGSPIPVGSSPQGVAVTPDGKFVYVANQADNTVSVINTTTNAVVTIPVGGTPVGVSITPDGRFAYVTNFADNTISVIEVASDLVHQTISLGNEPSSFGMFVGPNIIVARGGLFLLIPNDVSLATLGFGRFVDFNGGTLKTTGSLMTSRTISLLVGGGTIDTNGFNSVFSGNIINSGSLTKVGAGTLTLSGNNTYTGGTNIAGGVLSVSSDSNLGTGNIGITNNAELLTTGPLFSSSKAINLGIGGGTLASVPGSVATYTGIISGTGGLTIGDPVDSGKVILTATNTYSGPTNVASGILRAGSSAALSPNSAFTVASVLDLNGFSNTIGSLSGNGTVTNDGAGSVILTVGNDNTNTIFSGTLADGKALLDLTKSGAGTLILTGNNSYSGGTVINAGTLVVASPLALGLGNVVVNGGVLRADPRPINVQGDYTQHAGGTLQLTVAGSVPGQYDFLSVRGHAALDGTLQLISQNGFQPKPGDRFILVTAGGGLSGRFADVIDPFSPGPRSTIELLYGPNDFVLEIVQATFASFALTPNQLAVARQLDKAQSDPRAAQLIAFLNTEPEADLPSDFERISPDGLSALYQISFSAADVQAANLENRFGEIRQGSNGISSSLRLTNAPATLTEGKDVNAAIESTKNPLTPSPENRWGFWISGEGDYVDVSGDGNAQGYDFTTGGITLGVDYRMTESFAVGIAAGYAHTGTNSTGGGWIETNSGRAGVYSTFFKRGFYLNGFIGGGFNGYETKRAALGGKASGSTNGGEFSALVNGGYDLHYGTLTFGPVASLGYTYVDFAGYTEHGSIAPLQIVSRGEHSLRTDFGVSLSYSLKAGEATLTPILQVTWQHEYSYVALPVRAQFASGVGGVFTVCGPALGHDSALIDAGLNLQLNPTVGVYFGYNGQVGRGNYDSHGGSCRVHIDF